MKTKYLNLILLLFTLFSCSEKEQLPISGSLGKPGVVTNVVVEPSAGGATISYKIPESEDLLAVKCIYTLSDNVEREANASFYENKLKIQGYNDTLEHTAILYAINRAQELSDPIEVKFRPLESPLSKAIKSVTIEADFGGARFNWKNPDKAPLNVEFLGPDSLGAVSTLNIITSDIDKNVYSIRGYEPELWQFSIIMSDNFNNYSDTISAEVVPMFEEKLDKKKMKIMQLNNDVPFTGWDSQNISLIDDDLTTFGHTLNNTLPAPFTVDLGCTAKLSRFVINQRKTVGGGENSYYQRGNPKKMEVYTCDHLPSESGDWSEWTKIMDCEVVKPSGSPGSTMTDLDMTVADNGHEFAFELSQAPMRYIRVIILSTWGGSTYTHPAEITFYGENQE
ncbi:hypothetical protein CE91St1_04120 [Parabacteroides goldsteinii]|uniref:DUF5000 domain-containing lipoprotein n=1 Tax=Parabacteroides goldsteinii TaxID=328812 RepID=UPI001FBBCAFD|nr:DUF5000 domain-containing lipoprotein [Parabacteroides goldsteinii]GKG71269.1 hypothetical protein CE91St1_04120 [Parabacteroides goldsteinii]GKG77222.1 hypothetical protein CE91St2_04140 [Parabacteroides goldsteinii]